MKIKNLIIVVVIIGALLTLKFVFFPSQTAQDSTQKQGVKIMPSNVSVFVAKAGKLENTVSASGTIVANEEVELKPETSGKIISLPLKEGTTVAKGELLAKINDADLQAQLKKLELTYELAQTQLKRQKDLLAINGISQQDFDVAQNTVNTNKADIEYTQSLIAKTEILAPFNGMIGLKRVSDGTYITAGTTIATIFQIDPVKVDFSIGESYAPYIEKGVKVIFNISGIKNQIEGEVYAIEPKIDMNTRTIQVRAICPNKEKAIFPGAFAHIQVLLKDNDNAIMIPTEAVIPEIRGKKVFIVKDGKAKSVPIETGVRTSSQIEVVTGLQSGDSVITSGIMQLKADAPVKVMVKKK